MTAEQLRHSLLQEAISGRLVPQDPNDEPASVLLARIREEKERLIKEKKLKKEKPSAPITEDEISFEIPTTWEWVRIGDIFMHTSGKQQSSSNKGGGTPQKFITTSNLYWGRFVLDKVKVMNFTEDELRTCSATKGDLLVCEGGAGYGRSAIWNYDYDICLQNHVHRLRPYISGTCEYVYYFIYLLKESNQLLPVGTAMPGLSANRLKGLLLPLPPLVEQQRIVAKLEELLPIVEQYGKAQTELDELNAALPSRLRQSVLQEAIKGKLVPQAPTEGTAEELLKQIADEKERLIKEKKLKKEKPAAPITDDEKPFEIPASWEWVRISTLYQTSSGGTPEKGHPEYYGGSIPWVKVGDLRSIYIDKTDDTISEVGLNNSSAKLFPVDTILVAMYCNDAIGKSSILKAPMTTNQAICGLYPNPHVCKEYIYYAIQANKGKLQEHAAGGAQKNINQKIVNDMVLPLPPLAEQQRIVAKIEELFAEIDKLK